ncbi:hypothetical protein C0036_16685 [Streptomyces sp. DJ]|nr:hypothetical protein C0036_16685 [Streptomyces sp. DJ]
MRSSGRHRPQDRPDLRVPARRRSSLRPPPSPPRPERARAGRSRGAPLLRAAYLRSCSAVPARRRSVQLRPLARSPSVLHRFTRRC